MTLLLQLAQSYTDPDSHGYKLAWQRAYLDDLLGDKDFGDLAFQDQVQLAMLGETVVQGGYLRTELLDARAMRIGDEQDSVLVTRDGIRLTGGCTRLSEGRSQWRYRAFRNTSATDSNITSVGMIAIGRWKTPDDPAEWSGE